MATCGTCGAEISSEAAYCKKCGSRREASAEKLADFLGQKKSRVLNGQRSAIMKVAVIAVAVFVALSARALYRAYRPKMSSASAPRQMAAAQGSPSRQLHTMVTTVDGQVKIPLKDLEEGTARYYVYSSGGTDIKFFVLRASDGSIRASLDACAACYHAKLGYRQNGDSVVCNNCNMSFKSTDIGIMSGGCSPIALDKTVDGQAVVLTIKDIEAGKKYF